MKRHTICDCLLCKPVEGRRAHSVYGYDLDKVKDINCLMCDQPIGDEPYVEDIAFARFGDMLFVHKRCDDEPVKGDAN